MDHRGKAGLFGLKRDKIPILRWRGASSECAHRAVGMGGGGTDFSLFLF